MSGPLKLTQLATPIGSFRVIYHGRTIDALQLLERKNSYPPVPEGVERVGVNSDPGSPARQLKEYFAGRRKSFDMDVQIDTGGTFDRTVWAELQKVPAGETVTYGQLARRSGYSVGAARAVGGAMHRNPVAIVIPCHRVVGDDRSLTGFGLGLWRKRWLLEHEGAWPLKGGTVYGPPDPAQRTLDAPETRGGPRPRVGRARAQPA